MRRVLNILPVKHFHQHVNIEGAALLARLQTVTWGTDADLHRVPAQTAAQAPSLLCGWLYIHETCCKQLHAIRHLSNFKFIFLVLLVVLKEHISRCDSHSFGGLQHKRRLTVRLCI